MVKGDNHTVLRNLVFDKSNEKKGDHQGNNCAVCLSVCALKPCADQQFYRGYVQRS